MRTYKLTDDCTLSGVRLLPEDRRVDGGGYFYPDCPDRLVPAHGFVEVPVGGAGLKAPAACQRRWNAGGGGCRAAVEVLSRASSREGGAGWVSGAKYIFLQRSESLTGALAWLDGALAKSLILLDSPSAEAEDNVAQTSKIEWTDVTWNPVAGCTIASPGCSNCYAMRMAARLEAMGSPKYVGLTRKSGGRAVWTGKVALDPKSLGAPYRWRKSRKVFVNSMSDLFHPEVPDEFILRVWTVMAETPQHTYQVLTKRPERMRALLSKAEFAQLSNVWVGTSVEDGAVLGRIDELRATPAYTRFVSFEPLIGSVREANLRDIHWAIVGGESGPRSRPMDPEWVEEIKSRCRLYGTAFFFKQWGGVTPKSGGRTLEGREWSEYPVAHLKEAVVL